MTARHKDQLILVLAVLCIVLAVALGKREVGGFSPQLPPVRYRGDAEVKVRFTRHATPYCGIIKAQPGSIACAVVGGDLIIAPNPCYWSDPYAELMCHELGHVNSWPAEHPK